MRGAAHSVQPHYVAFGRETIPFSLSFGPRERLAITVHPDRSVTVIAPRGCSLHQVLERVRQRRGWIARQRAYFERFHPLPTAKRYVSGETHLFLGRQYRLKVRAGAEGSVKLLGRFLHVHLPHTQDRHCVRTAVDRWYVEHAEAIFATELSKCLHVGRRLGLHVPGVQVRRMSRRWGSCSKRGAITLNLELVKTPLCCIEYVILHELCHIRVPKHSPAFQKLLSRLMPDWQVRKARLDSFVL